MKGGAPLSKRLRRPRQKGQPARRAAEAFAGDRAAEGFIATAARLCYTQIEKFSLRKGNTK